MEKIKSVQIFYNKDKSRVQDIISHLKEVFKRNSIDVILSRDIKTPDIIIAIGGDGTLLKTAYNIKSKGIPVMGINMGSLGFLTEIPVPEIDSAVEKLLKGKYRIEERAVLRMDCEGKTDYALNDHVISQTPDMRMVSLDVYVDRAFLTNVFADGLIVSSPTGSTAYSLACGGPILIPGVRGIVLTPISPHSLNMRPIVVSDDKTITIRTLNDAMVVSDGQRKLSIRSGTEVNIRLADFSLNLIRIGKRNFYDIIRDKLGWGKANKK